MTTPPTPSIFDGSQLAAIKRQSRSNDPAALKAAAQQFEALFLQMVLKSMREATPKDGLFDNDQTRLYESLLDQQMGQVLARRGAGGKGGLGLAALIESQMSRHAADMVPESFPDGLPLTAPVSPRPLDPARTPLPLPAPSVPGLPVSAVPLAPSSTSPASGVATEAAKSTTLPPAAAAFVDRIWPDAVQASRATGIPARFIVAQAALESGWGRSEPRLADGRPSHNLFGVKAGRNWAGDVVETATIEYVDGIAQQKVERFRAYGSDAEAIRDYANLLISNPRYAAVLGVTDATEFARALQRAGYATDPAYAEKLTRIIGGQALASVLPA